MANFILIFPCDTFFWQKTSNLSRIFPEKSKDLTGFIISVSNTNQYINTDKICPKIFQHLPYFSGLTFQFNLIHIVKGICCMVKHSYTRIYKLGTITNKTNRKQIAFLHKYFHSYTAVLWFNILMWLSRLYSQVDTERPWKVKM